MMPKIKIPAMTRVVMTGRRMKISEMFMPAGLYIAPLKFSRPNVSLSRPGGGLGGVFGWGLDFHLGSGRQSELAVYDHRLPGLKAVLNDGVAAGRLAGLNWTHLGSHVRFDHKYILSRLPRLDGLGRHHGGVRPGAEPEHHV